MSWFERSNHLDPIEHGAELSAWAAAARLKSTRGSSRLPEEWNLFPEVKVANPENLDLLGAAIGPRIRSLFAGNGA